MTKSGRVELTSFRGSASGCLAKPGEGRTAVIGFPGAGHGFFNDTHADAYRRAAANDAWRPTTVAQFGRHLR